MRKKQPIDNYRVRRKVSVVALSAFMAMNALASSSAYARHRVRPSISSYESIQTDRDEISSEVNRLWQLLKEDPKNKELAREYRKKHQEMMDLAFQMAETMNEVIAEEEEEA